MKTPRIAAVAAAALVALAARAGRCSPLPERAPNIAEYTIAVRLDAALKELRGKETLTWHSPAGEPVEELWLHLYLNAFRNSLSTFYRESGGIVRGDRAAQDDWGWIDVTALRLADGRDLLPGLTFEHPDDDNADDRTVARVALPEPVPPGGSVTVEIEFTDRLPRVYARSGWQGDFFAVGQWFPKVAVYETPGTRGRENAGWNCHQYHGNSEFYADFGQYRVEITTPSRFVVGATGRRVAQRPGPDGTTTVVYEQSDVHDFNWTADPRFVEILDTFSARRDVTAAEYAAAAARLGRPLDEVELRDVAIRFLFQPENREQAERYRLATKLALKSLGLRYGRYPYPMLTVVDPPADGARGVEYPTLVYAGTSERLRTPFNAVREPEITLVHEIAHQFWYGLVANNEFEDAWMDEGFATYATDLVMNEGWGAKSSFVSFLGIGLGAPETDQIANGTSRRFDDPRSFAWRYGPRQYGFFSYARPALVLHTLAGLVGEDTMARIMRTYSERWRYRHPGAEDFYAVASEVAGRDLSSYFEQTMEKPGIFSPAIVSLTSEPRQEPRGRLGDASPEGLTTAAQADRAARQAAARGETVYRSVVVLEQKGEISLPVEVELVWEGAPAERRTWEAGERWIRWELDNPRRLVEVRLDPDRRLPLDVSRLDNRRRLEPDARTAATASGIVLFFLQQTMAIFGL